METKAAPHCSFEEFFRDAEPRLRTALSACLGPIGGRDAAVDALAYGWEHWDRISEMANPVGYLYRVGCNGARRSTPLRTYETTASRQRSLPWIEPGLEGALAALSERQRVVVTLLHSFEWTMREVAELLDLTKATVQTHAERGMAHLREDLGVSL